MYRDYKAKDVDFYFIYKSLAHPQTNGFVRPSTLDERVKHVAIAKESIGATIPWLVDAMDNRLKHAMGNRPNSEFIIDPKGKIVRMRDWSNPGVLRQDLEKLVGKVANPTDPRSLDIDTRFEQTKVARGVVKRIRPERGMRPFIVTTDTPVEHPAYIKLRAEGDGRGKLYLGFFVDPIHLVHWNNGSGPVQLEVNGKLLTGPEVKEKADADPREFLVDVKPGTVSITLRYVACDDKETWCKSLTQTFKVQQKQDPDAGRVSSGGGRSRQRPGMNRPPFRRRPFQIK